MQVYRSLKSVAGGAGGGDVYLDRINNFTKNNDFLGGNLKITDSPDWVEIGSGGRIKINGIYVQNWTAEGVGSLKQIFTGYSSGNGTQNINKDIPEATYIEDMASISLPSLVVTPRGFTVTIIQAELNEQTFMNIYGDAIKTAAGKLPTTNGQYTAMTAINEGNHWIVIGALKSA